MLGECAVLITPIQAAGGTLSNYILGECNVMYRGGWGDVDDVGECLHPTHAQEHRSKSNNEDLNE